MNFALKVGVTIAIISSAIILGVLAAVYFFGPEAEAKSGSPAMLNLLQDDPGLTEMCYDGVVYLVGKRGMTVKIRSWGPANNNLLLQQC